MELRTILMPPILDEDKVKHLTALSNEVVNRFDSGLNCSDLLAAFNHLSLRPYDVLDFDGAMGSIGMEQFAKQALIPDAPQVPDITREEYLEIIQRVASAKYEESQTNYWLELLQRNLPHPAVSGLIFWDDLTPEQILEKALAYKSIVA